MQGLVLVALVAGTGKDVAEGAGAVNAIKDLVVLSLESWITISSISLGI